MTLSSFQFELLPEGGMLPPTLTDQPGAFCSFEVERLQGDLKPGSLAAFSLNFHWAAAPG